MKKLSWTIPVLLLLMGFNDRSEIYVTDDKETTLIRVISTDPDSEAKFTCAYITDGSDRSIQYLEKTTPFELKFECLLFCGLFRQTSEKGQMSVRMVHLKDGKEQGGTTGTSPSIVMMYDQLQNKYGKGNQRTKDLRPTAFTRIF